MEAYQMDLLRTMLQANCPVDTHNMQTHIFLEDYGDYWEIVISGPRLNYDYAKAVNNNRQRTIKEARNYHWIERTIHEWAEIMGGNVQYELS